MKRLLGLVVLLLALLPGATPVRAQRPARAAGYRYLSPVPEAPYVSAQTRYVLVRFENVTPSAVTNLTTSFITVTGESSGRHSGVTRVASDGRTVMFEMAVDFNQNEPVTVTLNPQLEAEGSGRLEPYEYQFMITAPMPGPVPAARFAAPTPAQAGDTSEGGEPSTGSGQDPVPGGADALARAMILPNGVSVPSDFPTVVITVNSNPAPGYLFLEPGVNGAANYTVMLDNNGLPVWYRRGRMWDFKIQPNGRITWCLAHGAGFPSFDQDFNYLQTYLTTNGYLTEGHDFKVLTDETYFMLGYRTLSLIHI